MRLLPTLAAALVAASLLAAAGPAPAAGQERVTITITVETPGGDPVPNADITATWVGGSTNETTRSNGKALFDVPRGADVTIRIDHPRFTHNQPFERNADDGKSITLTVHPEGQARVTVVRQGTGAPVANARVFIARNGTALSGQTNDQGVFETGVVEQGVYRYSVRKPGFYDGDGEIDINGTVRQEVALEAGQETVTFRVVDSHFDPPQPVANATVRIGSLATVNTSGDGTFSIGVPVNSVYDITVERAGYESASERLIVQESPRRMEFSISRIPVLELTTANTKVVVGQAIRVDVVDEYGSAIEGATVLVNGTAAGETDASGSLEVPIETAGPHELLARAEGVESDSVIVEGVVGATPTTTTTTTTITTTTTTTSTTTTSTTTPTTTTATTTSQFGPGFGPVGVLAALALLGTALLALRRR